MPLFNKYTKLIPYLYFIAIIAYWFTDINRNNGITAYPILLFAIPFLWQLIKPNKKLNLTLGITFVCLSSYLILAYLSDLYNLTSFTEKTQKFIIYGGLFVLGNFIMALWIIRNSLKESI
ncbi:hypothetical protein SAMN05428642_102904 [Flaviramulus basaltis]|uniref:Transmembrane family 220, helix n=1 Tax=Flaviramulus basaltis TaxID=369401 RepID=A0A1K2IJT4_9FLAO|nr:hypothetical protein [Flaviramulus basaltis]SFZ92705.1 hypothetical protein SAMN05428642_102904 [Flaviramulus basaltis]